MVRLNIKIIRIGTNAWKIVRQKPKLKASRVKVYCALLIVIGGGYILEPR